MTVKKSLKRRVRARMAKTGERYTAARRQMIAKAGQADAEPAVPTEFAIPAEPAEPVVPAEPAVPPEPTASAEFTIPNEPTVPAEPAVPDGSKEPAVAPEPTSSSPAAAALAKGESVSPADTPPAVPPMAAASRANERADNSQAGRVKLDVSDESMRRRTGRGWEEWFALLDAWGATERKHPEIASWLNDMHQVDGWWAQSITVGYERARGMRAMHQLTDGFAASASKTVDVPAEHLYEAFADEALRARWLPAMPLTIRSGRPGKSLHAILTTVQDGANDPGGTGSTGGATRVDVTFTAKGAAKCQVAVQHLRLPNARAAEEMKAFWRERLAALKLLLEH